MCVWSLLFLTFLSTFHLLLCCRLRAVVPARGGPHIHLSAKGVQEPHRAGSLGWCRSEPVCRTLERKNRYPLSSYSVSQHLLSLSWVNALVLETDSGNLNKHKQGPVQRSYSLLHDQTAILSHSNLRQHWELLHTPYLGPCSDNCHVTIFCLVLDLSHLHLVHNLNPHIMAEERMTVKWLVTCLPPI